MIEWLLTNHSSLPGYQIFYPEQLYPGRKQTPPHYITTWQKCQVFFCDFFVNILWMSRTIGAGVDTTSRSWHGHDTPGPSTAGTKRDVSCNLTRLRQISCSLRPGAASPRSKLQRAAKAAAGLSNFNSGCKLHSLRRLLRNKHIEAARIHSQNFKIFFTKRNLIFFKKYDIINIEKLRERKKSSVKAQQKTGEPYV